MNSRIKRETEDMLMSFMLEMREENEKFIHTIKNVSKVEYKEEKKEIMKDVNRQFEVVEREIDYKEFLPSLSLIEEEKLVVVSSEEVPTSDELSIEEMIECARRMQETGYSIEEIASKLHKGKTEMELLLKFRA